MDIRETASGAFGALCCISAGQPFDVVKARMQAANNQNGAQKIGAWTCAKNTIRKEGPKALFKGFNAALASSMTENVVVWTVNSFLRAKLENHAGSKNMETSNKQQALLGAMTGACSAVCICPAEVIKVRQQTRANRPSASILAKEIMKEAGPGGFFYGLKPLLMRDVPFYFLFFGAMETYFDKVAAFDEDSSTSHTLFHSAVGGGLAGSFAWAVVFPLDVLKTRQQVYGGRFGLLETLRSVLRNEGPRGLFNGWLPAVLRGFPANGALVLGVHMARFAFEEYDVLTIQA